MSKKRIRSSNWDRDEKRLLCSLLKNYEHIIENKSLTSKSNIAKAKAWHAVYKRFNDLNSHHRGLTQLQVQWKTMKVCARKQCSIPNKNVAKTLLDSEDPLGDFNVYDSNGCTFNQTDSELQDVNQILLNDPIQNVETIIEDQSITEIPTNTTQLSPNNLEATPKIKEPSNNASINKRFDGTPLFKRNLNYRNAIVNHTKMLKEAELRRRMEMAEEEHALKIKILQENLSCSIIEREILELKKEFQNKINNN